MMSRWWASLLLVVLLPAAAGCRKATPPPVGAPPASEPAEPSPPADPGRVAVVVNDKGFVPSRIPAKAGMPITLVITRKTDQTCAREILFQGQEGKTDLPLNSPVEVTYTPDRSGEIKFGCAMGMMIGGVLAVSD